MPLYEYRCSACARDFEAYRRMSEENGNVACPVCGGTSEKLRISLFSAGGTAPEGKSGASSCGGGSRRSPFS